MYIVSYLNCKEKKRMLETNPIFVRHHNDFFEQITTYLSNFITISS